MLLEAGQSALHATYPGAVTPMAKGSMPSRALLSVNPTKMTIPFDYLLRDPISALTR